MLLNFKETPEFCFALKLIAFIPGSRCPHSFQQLSMRSTPGAEKPSTDASSFSFTSPTSTTLEHELQPPPAWIWCLTVCTPLTPSLTLSLAYESRLVSAHSNHRFNGSSFSIQTAPLCKCGNLYEVCTVGVTTDRHNKHF